MLQHPLVDIHSATFKDIQVEEGDLEGKGWEKELAGLCLPTKVTIEGTKFTFIGDERGEKTDLASAY